MIVDLAGRPCFRFIGMFIVGLAIGLGRVEDLAISGAVLMGADVTIGFSGLFL